MMTRVPPIHLTIICQQREIHHPHEFKLVARNLQLAQFHQSLCRIDADAAKNLTAIQPLARREQNQIAFLNSKFLSQRRLFRIAEKLHDRRLPLAAFHLDKREPLRAKVLSQFRHRLHLPLCHARVAFCIKRLHHTAIGYRTTENFEFARRKLLREIRQLQPIPCVRLVATPTVHHVFEWYAREWRRHINIQGFLPNPRQQPLDHRVQILTLDERHLDIHLRKLWLTVCPQVLIAVTSCQLEVFVHSCAHQDLFELLWRLRQCVKFPRRQAARR